MLKIKSTCKALSISVLMLLFLVIFVKTSIACRLYGAISDNLPDNMLEAHLITDPNSLFELSHLHTDGWGIAYYPTYGDTPTIERGAIRAWNDSGYTTVVNQINLLEPNITLAHIRLCTSGCCDHDGDSIANPHPFYRTKNGKTWTFSHNGGVSLTRLYALIGEEYLSENGPYGSDVPSCTTSDPYDPIVIDSELYFLHILKNIEENDWDVVNGIVEAVMELINDGETGGMIFLLSDGNTIWAFLRGSIPSYHTLYYEYNSVEGYSAVASQYPSDSQGNWQSINNNELVVLTANEAPVIINVTLYDGIPDSQDNCPNTPNGPLLGTCVKTKAGMVVSYRVGDPKEFITCTSDADCEATDGTCQMNQGDCNSNGCGDVCECYMDCNNSGAGDGKVTGTDLGVLKQEYGRFDCTELDPCYADGNEDGKVTGSDLSLSKNEYGRFDCPACP